MRKRAKPAQPPDQVRSRLSPSGGRGGSRIQRDLLFAPFLGNQDRSALPLAENYYETTTRYATNAFLRLKMQEALKRRGLAPHVFERKEDAHAFLERAGGGEGGSAAMTEAAE